MVRSFAAPREPCPLCSTSGTVSRGISPNRVEVPEKFFFRTFLVWGVATILPRFDLVVFGIFFPWGPPGDKAPGAWGFRGSYLTRAGQGPRWVTR